jgi:hypothetical protein
MFQKNYSHYFSSEITNLNENYMRFFGSKFGKVFVRQVVKTMKNGSAL